MPGTAPLPELLQRVFGHHGFRAHQQPVCEAAAAGRDVLLVMPTGAGKSLCYQLPTLARGGTGLVISPLIALMDDQASKMRALNLRVARIHSGLSREHARQACRDYLDGSLDFLFIAPERLRVPGFPEMLARRKPALVAIDEAHCISQWGHDFRPDYRTLGQHLPALRPAPVLALTATATPTVQQDILRALHLQDPAVFITGFRRDNLHIEAAELSKPQRQDFIAKLLSNPEARPAIVYASSRKSAEELASALHRHFPVAAYHAGLDPGTRERVQAGFSEGKLDVVVATVAFGMGVDKANVRTVVHAALPGSVEAYYQEIGRAGRDGLPSRAILLHSFADRKTQEFLLERSYPALNDLEQVRQKLSAASVTMDSLLQGLHLDRETLERCVEKLVSQGAAAADFDGGIRLAEEAGWQRQYDAQVRHRRGQIDAMIGYAEGTGCRMNALVRHFGDKGDAGHPCGICDNCRPEGVSATETTRPSAEETALLLAILSALRAGGRSTGKLHTELGSPHDRKQFDRLLDGLARAGLVHMAAESFRAEDGRDITFRKVSLTAEGRTPDEAALSTVWLRGASSKPDVKKREVRASGRSPRSSGSGSSRSSQPDAPLTGEQAELFEALKSWRAQEAQRRGAPAFTIFHDSVLRTLASSRPANLTQLGTISGIGPEKLDKFGVAVLALCRGERTTIPVPHDASRPRRPQPRPEEAGSSQSAPTAERVRASLPFTPRVLPGKEAGRTEPHAFTPEQVDLDLRLRSWRQEQATSSGLPTFFILSETALRKVVTATPRSLEDLKTIDEIGPEKLARYGSAVLAVCCSA